MYFLVLLQLNSRSASAMHLRKTSMSWPLTPTNTFEGQTDSISTQQWNLRWRGREGVGKLSSDVWFSTLAVSLEPKGIKICITVLWLIWCLELHVCFLHITHEHCFLCVYNYIFLNVLKVTEGFKTIEINNLVLWLSQSLELHVCNVKITPAHFFVCVYV